LIVTVDLSDMLEMSAKARAELRSVPTNIRKIGTDAANFSKRSHLYVNRTGRTQARTISVSENTRDAAYTLVTIDVSHASYLMKGGTMRRHESLTAMEDAIKVASTELEYFMDGIGSDLDR
jgi:hypothetical protein